MATTVSNTVFLYVKLAKVVDLKSPHCTHTHKRYLWSDGYVKITCIRPSAIHLKLLQHCKSAISQ